MTDADLDMIPDELKERERWLLWGACEPRKRPHDEHGNGARWKKDTDCFLTFEEATTAAEELEAAEGVGMVVLEDDPYVVLDLDSCFTEPGDAESTREWVPPLDLFKETYTEFSQSGEGLHPITKGSRPEWWTDTGHPEREHEGVEVESESFIIFTGRPLPGASEEITELDLMPWLTAAHRGLTGELPSALQDHDAPDEGPADSERSVGGNTQAILDAIDDLDAREVADRTIVHRWTENVSGKRSAASAENKDFIPTWGKNANGTANIVDSEGWTDTGPRGGCGGPVVMAAIDKGLISERAAEYGAVTGQDWWEAVDHLRELGFDIPEYEAENPAPSDMTESDAAERLSEILDYHKTEESDPSAERRREIGELLGRVDDERFQDLKDRAADVLDTSRSLSEHRRLMQHKLADGSLLVEDGATYYLSGTPLQKHEILNFKLEVESFLQVPGEPERVELALTAGDDRFTKRVEPSVFNDTLRFKDEVTGERFGMTFETNGRHPSDVLDDVNRYISTRDAPTRTGTHHMGLHGSEIVTPDGSLTAEGWTDDPEYVYLSRELGIERAFDLPTDSAEYDPEDVGRILRDLPRTRDVSRFLPVLGWYYAAPFRPHIDEWEGGFNLLNVTGDTGSGKTTTLRYLWRCFGMGGEPFDARDTWFVLLSTYGATNSLPVWHDEYKPSDMTKREVDRFHDALRKTATGQIAQRGNADKSTTEYHLRAPAVVSGEQQIQEPAERRRSIMVKFKTSVTEEGTETRRRFKELVGSGIIEEGELVLPDEAPDPANHALAYYQFVAGMSETEVREVWLDAREKVWNIRESWSTDYTLDDMEIQGLRTVVFGYNMMHEFAEHVGADPADLPSERELEIGLRHVAEAVGPDGERKSHLDKFVELFERAAAAEGYVEEGVDYTFVREGTAEEELRINVSRAYDKLSRYARDHGLDAEDLLDAAAYKDRFQTAAEEDGGYVTAYGQNTPPLNRCVGVSTIKAMNALEFDRATFNVEPMDSGLEADSSGDDGGGDGDAPTTDTSDETPAAAATDGGQATETAETAGEGNMGPWPEYISVPADEIGAAPNAKRIAQYLKESQEGGVMGRSALETTVTLTFDALTPDELEAALEAGERKEGILEVTDSEVRSLL